MKFICLDGKEINIHLSPSKNYVGKVHRSDLQTVTGQKLIEIYPYEQIMEDFVVPRTRLSLDFFIPRRKIAVEVNPIKSGHTEHNAFFHGQKTSGKFVRQIKNDVNKVRFCELNGIYLITIKTEDDLCLLK